MQRPPRSTPPEARILLFALAFGAWVVAGGMYKSDGLAEVPLERLPLLFWVLLLSVPVLMFVAVLVWDFTPTITASA